MGRDENVLVFEDTAKLCKENKTLADAIRDSNREQKLILEKDDISERDKNIYNTPAKVVIVERRILSFLGDDLLSAAGAA